MQDNKKILFVGYGKMGSAIASGMISSGYAATNIMAIDPHLADIKEPLNIHIVSEFNQEQIEQFRPDYIIFAVKPQSVADIIQDYTIFTDSAVFISILAGKKIEFLTQYLGNKAKIIRLMPNLPVIIGKGVMGLYANKETDIDEINFVSAIFSCSENIVVNVKNEDEIDIVTAISGSGPAYIFHFAECLIKAGQNMGLSKDTATKLALNTIYGSASLAVTSDDNVHTLQENVTSKGGTTEAALQVLMDDNNLQNLMMDAVNAAYNRAKEL